MRTMDILPTYSAFFLHHAHILLRTLLRSRHAFSVILLVSSHSRSCRTFPFAFRVITGFILGSNTFWLLPRVTVHRSTLPNPTRHGTERPLKVDPVRLLRAGHVSNVVNVKLAVARSQPNPSAVFTFPGKLVDGAACSDHGRDHRNLRESWSNLKFLLTEDHSPRCPR